MRYCRKDVSLMRLSIPETLEIKPDFAQARNNLASCLLQTGQRDEAIVQFQKTLAINPGYVVAYNDLGYCYLLVGRPEMPSRI